MKISDTLMSVVAQSASFPGSVDLVSTLLRRTCGRHASGSLGTEHAGEHAHGWCCPMYS